MRQPFERLKMSTAKMVADSTVSSDLLGERRKRQKSSENKRSKKSKKSSKNPTKKDPSEDSDSDLDLSKELKSIGEYVKDRDMMLDQMFRAVRGPSLNRALPDILQDLSTEDLKRRCLEQLEIMSKKRILRILEGANPADISSSGTDESSAEDVEDNTKSPDRQSSAVSGDLDQFEEEIEYIEVEEEVEVTDDGSQVEDVEAPSGSDSDVHEESAEEGEDVEQDEEGREGRELSPEEMSDEEKAQETLAPILTKDQMEILELEMRARAIKAMLNKQPKLTSKDRLPSSKTDSPVISPTNAKDKDFPSDDDSAGVTQTNKPSDSSDNRDTASDQTSKNVRFLKRNQSVEKKLAIDARTKGKMSDFTSPVKGGNSLNDGAVDNVVDSFETLNQNNDSNIAKPSTFVDTESHKVTEHDSSDTVNFSTKPCGLHVPLSQQNMDVVVESALEESTIDPHSKLSETVSALNVSDVAVIDTKSPVGSEGATEGHNSVTETGETVVIDSTSCSDHDQIEAEEGEIL